MQFEPCARSQPDKVVKLDKAQVRMFDLPNKVTVAQEVCEPGWRWSTHAKQHAGGDACQRDHTGFMTRGRLVCQWQDGRTKEFVAGQAFFIPAGHDAWVEGDEAAELYDFTGWGEKQQPGGIA
jgi:quercetin dioxygenase-like cupin family protein